MLYDDVDEQNAILNCPCCKQQFFKGQQTDGRITYIFCKRCKAIITVLTDHAVTNSFDLRKIKEKLGISD